MKKTICFALALIMMLAMVPLTASAYEIDEQGVYYELNEDGTEYYVCNLSKTAENVTIPANFNDLPVTTIDYYAFSDSPNLKSVTVGSNVTFIDSYAFQNCTGLETITIPSWVSKVGINVFKGCTNLQTINCRHVNRTSGWDKYWNAGCDAAITWLKAADNQGVVYRAQGSGDEFHVVDSHDESANVIIPDTYLDIPVTAIEYGAFNDCVLMESVSIGTNVTSIESFAFRHCTGLTAITITSKVTQMGDYVFEGCTALETVDCRYVKRPDGWSVDWNLGCDAEILWLKAADDQGVVYRAQGAGDEFHVVDSHDESANVIIPDTYLDIPVTAIEYGAFNDCVLMESVSIGTNVTSIESFAFRHCTGLTAITIPENVTRLENNVFYGCVNLADIWTNKASRPDGWDADWNAECDAAVHWLESESMLGDINLNGMLDSMDYFLLKRSYFDTYFVDASAAFDMNGNESFDSMDYFLLKRYYFGAYAVG